MYKIVRICSTVASADLSALHSFLTGISVIQDAAICWLCDYVFIHWLEAALSLNDFVHLYVLYCTVLHVTILILYLYLFAYLKKFNTIGYLRASRIVFIARVHLHCAACTACSS